MSSQFRPTELQNLWQNQETEKTIMSVEHVRLNAKKLLRKSQRDLIARSAFVILAVVCCGIFLLNARINSLRLVAGVVTGTLMVSTAWSLYRAYRRSSGNENLVEVGAPLAMKSCLEFYRSELERQLEFARLPAWQLVTVLLIIVWMTRDALMRNSADPFRAVLPFVLFAAAGMIGLMAVRKVQGRRAQAEMDALDLFEEGIQMGGSDDAAIDDSKK